MLELVSVFISTKSLQVYSSKTTAINKHEQITCSRFTSTLVMSDSYHHHHHHHHHYYFPFFV